MRLSLMFCTLLLSLGLTRMEAQQSSGQIAKPEPLGLTTWIPSPTVPGAARMLLVGDPAKHTIFAARFRFPDGVRLGPHWHTATVYATVLQWKLVLGFGDHVDSSAVKEYGPGSFIVFEGGVRHFEWFRGETILHVEGVGPSKTEFLNPADDPLKAKK